MVNSLSKTAERGIPTDFRSCQEYLLYLRHRFAYEFSKAYLTTDNSVLEVGCGEGYGTHILSERVQQIVGLDVDRAVIEHATAKYGSDRCHFCWYSGSKIPFANAVFDTVISYQVVEHIQDDRTFIAEACRVLKPGGLLILTTPNRSYRLQPGQKPWNHFHIREYNTEQLTTLLSDYFSSVTLWGVQAISEIKEIEAKRIQFSQKIPRWLRKVLPASLGFRLGEIVKDLVGTRSSHSPEFLSRYSLNHFFLEKANIDQSLDLVGICRK